jgi:hypothetical protein
MNFTQTELPGEAGDTSMKSLNWTYVLDDAGLPDGHMRAVYPLGVNVLLASSGKGHPVDK